MEPLKKQTHLALRLHTASKDPTGLNQLLSDRISKNIIDEIVVEVFSSRTFDLLNKGLSDKTNGRTPFTSLCCRALEFAFSAADVSTY